MVRLGLFCLQRGRKFFRHRSDLIEEAVQETLTRTCERGDRANQRGCPEAWVVNTATHVCQEKLREEACRPARRARNDPEEHAGAWELPVRRRSLQLRLC